MSHQLHEQVEAVTSRADFVAFVRALRANLEAHSAEWQHSTLEAYLDAIAAWTEEGMDSYYRNYRGQEPPIQPTWRVLAEILIAASVYE